MLCRTRPWQSSFSSLSQCPGDGKRTDARAVRQTLAGVAQTRSAGSKTSKIQAAPPSVAGLDIWLPVVVVVRMASSNQRINSFVGKASRS